MTKLFNQHIERLLMFFMAVGVALLLVIKTTFNGGFYITMQYVTVPWVLIIFGFTAVKTRRESNLKRQAWFLAIIMYALAVFFSYPYFLALNSIGMQDEIVAYSGPITDIHKSSSGKYPSTITIRDIYTNEFVEFHVNHTQVDQLYLGASYKSCFYRGRFDIPFVWRFSAPPKC